MLKLQNYIMNKLMQHTFQNDDEVYLYMMSYVATTFCLVIHIFLLGAFIAAGITTFIAFNIVSILVYVSLWPVIKRKHYTTVGLVISAEVMVYTTAFCFLAGATTFTFGYFILIIIMQVLVPYGTRKMRVAVISAVLVCLTLCITKEAFFQNVILLSNSFSYMLYIANVYIVFIGTTVELYVSNTVKLIVQQFTNIKINELFAQANTDSLTKLYNRHYADYFFLKMQTEALGQQYYVAMLDIDDFKRINDTYGHHYGDEVLKFLADYLKRNLRKTDTIFRWGGEEFLIILEGVSEDTAFLAMEKIRKGIASEAVVFEGQEMNFTITVGLTALNRENPYGSITESDEKLYRGKQNQKNQVVMFS